MKEESVASGLAEPNMNDERGVEDQPEPTLRSDYRNSMGLIGFSLYWTWFTSTMFGRTVVLPTPADLYIEPLFREVCFVFMGLAFLALLACGKRVWGPLGIKVLAALPLVLSPWLYVVTGSTVDVTTLSLPLELLVWALYGISAACLLVQNSFFFSTLSRKSAFFNMGMAVILGSVMYFFISTIDRDIALVVLAFLPYASVLCLGFTGALTYNERAYGLLSAVPARRHLVASFRTQPTQVFYGIAFGLALGIGASTSTLAAGTFSMMIAAAFCLAGPCLLIASVALKKIDVTTLQWFLIPVVIAALLPITFVSDNMIIFCCAVLALCYSLYDLTHTLSLTELMQEQDESTPQIFSSGKTLVFFGISIGWGIGYLLLVEGEFHTPSFTTAIMLLAAALSFVIAFVGRPGNREKSEVLYVTQEKSDVDWERVCIGMGEKAGLSPRQQEIFFYLARGRNATHIESKLVISHHTVKSHIYRIYQKTGVHSQQELIDLVEAELRSTSG